ncbi:MAG: hypothetical protein COU42_00385 [Candidatus Nealsonbacteria bacterium CG10_big_fil_rev_8_21_14_0_10_36_24]|uniref:UDP-N-acetylmuramoyl-L-alanyl-D-glutamate--2, 6-diaminopimelate ligase n=2 Tax=Candidatus Nealsoniibacteriota TaxID=1817911 RepID=A0A2H0YNU6_9BACT|nr:MAG: hypothetical protein COU42_00385 [Candidatus Nealsonbacteria bacterium CG10_big_fil_rev_8_21_14_0_10_36_24]PIS40177.1 MAG: hypothetical protein COT32_01125 [Candidatus Nealsonbacteria bacterium CG08_land_8_20_14_0_20_36_22]
MLKRIIKKIAPSFLLDFYHYLLALTGAFLYGFPSWRLIIIGVTGTSGKSTIVELAAKILEEAGFKVASLSSIKFKIGEKERENKLKMTMPGRLKIQKFLSQAVKTGCKYAVLEVTSEGIKQFRHKFIKFDVAVLTNLSPEHIEAHAGFEKYREAKLKLFKNTKKIHIINLDDENAEYFWKIPAEKKIGYRLNEAAKLLPKNLNLLGEFNLYNALAAVHIGLSQGISLDICKRALEKIRGIPGRMEIVVKEPFIVVVDYAHTPEALKKVYETLKGAKLICVLGACGGGRDKWKRPVLGKIAAKYCQEVIITNEDPYDENPIEIIEQVAGDTNAKKVLDRGEAIKEALKLAQPRDVVVITGKGSEPWMCVAHCKKIPWDDRQVVKEKYKNLTKIR